MSITGTDFAEEVGRYWACRAAFDKLADAFNDLPEQTDEEVIEGLMHTAFDRLAVAAQVVRASRPRGHGALRRIMILTDFAALTDQPEPIVA